MTCTSARSKVADHMDMHWCDRGTSFESQLQRIKGTSAEKELEWERVGAGQLEAKRKVEARLRDRSVAKLQKESLKAEVALVAVQQEEKQGAAHKRLEARLSSKQ